MRLIAVIMLLFVASGMRGQDDSVKVLPDILMKMPVTTLQAQNEYDKIKLDSGDSIIVNIIAETPTEVAFKYPLNTMINKMLLTRIKVITYKDGKTKEVVSQSLTGGVGAEPDNLWRIVVVTYEENDVAGLKEIGPISAKAEGKTLKTKIDQLEKNATLSLQKKAIRMSATKVLVKKKNIEQSYGEIPMVELEGVAYGAN